MSVHLRTGNGMRSTNVPFSQRKGFAPTTAICLPQLHQLFNRRWGSLVNHFQFCKENFLGQQVWSLTQFFSVSFLLKLIDLASSGKHYSLPFLPATPSSPSRILEGLFELTRRPLLASCVASGTTEILGHHQVCRARRGGPRTPSTTTDANLDCAFVENALFDTDP